MLKIYHWHNDYELRNGNHTIRLSSLGGLCIKEESEAVNKTEEFGAYTKEEIRKIAAEVGIPVAHKAESMEICFIPDHDYANFIKKYTDGEIFDVSLYKDEQSSDGVGHRIGY